MRAVTTIALRIWLRLRQTRLLRHSGNDIQLSPHGQREPRLAMRHIPGRRRRPRTKDHHSRELPELATPLPVHRAARLRHAGPTERGPVLRGALV